MNQARHLFTLFLLTTLLCISVDTKAQQFVDLTISIESVEHDFQCCTDALGVGCGTLPFGIPLWDRPEPRWIFNEKLSSAANFGPNVLINPNALGLSTNCDANSTINLNTFINSYTGICENTFDLQILSWEDDSGSENEYDDGSILGINPDDNPAGPEVFSINFLNFAAGQNHVVSLAQAQNGYVTNVRFQWNVSATQYPAPIVDNATPAICNGGSVDVSVISALSATNNEFEWYFDAALTQPHPDSPSSSITIANAPISIWVVEVGVAGCRGAATQIDATVAPPPAPPTAPDVSTCPNGLAIVTATPAVPGNTVVWFVDAAGTIDVSTNYSYTTGAISPPSQTFYVAEVDVNTGCQSNIIPVVVTTDLVVPPPTAINYTVCQGETTQLNATSNSGLNGTLVWYGNAALTNTVFIGSPFTPDPFNTPGVFTYWVVEEFSGCQSAPEEVQITVNTLPLTPLTSDETICAGQTATLTAVGAGGGMFWFSDAAGLAQLNTVSSTTYTTPILFSNETYYVGEVSTDGCLSELSPANVEVLPLPSQPSSSSVTVCEGEDATLSATIGETDGMITWYLDDGTMAQQDVVLPATSSYTVTNPPVGSNIYYVAYTDTDGCESALTTVAVNVTATPAAPTSIADLTVCEGSVVTISAGVGTFNWYLDAADTSPYSSGQSFTSPSALTATTSFYVSEFVNGCESDKDEVIVTVQAALSAPLISSNSPVCLGDDLMLNSLDPTNSNYTYTWTGPNGFSSSLENPTFATTSASLNSGIYTLMVEDVSGCTASSTTIVEVLSTPQGAPLFSNSSVCEGATIELSTSAVAGATYTWTGAGIPGGTDQTSTPTYSIANALVSYSGTYEVSVSTGSGCDPQPSSTTVVVDPIPAAPTASNIIGCEGDNIILFATGSGELEYSLLGSSVSPIIGTGLASGIYNYEVVSKIGDCESTPTIITVSINAEPDAPVTTNISVCEGESVVLSAVSSNTVSWSENADGTSPVADPNLGALPAGSYVYYASASDGNCTSETSSLIVTVGVNPSAIPTTTNIIACEGDNVVLAATGSGVGTLNYSLGGSSVSPIVGTGLAPGIYNYMVTESIGDCESMPATITVSINAEPDAPVTTDISVCEGESVVLSAVSSNTVSWSENADGTSPVANPDLGTSLPAGSYVYYASASDGTCTSEASSLSVTVGVNPSTIPTTTDITACEGDNVVLSATGSGVGTLNYSLGGSSVSPIVGTGLTPGIYNYMVTENIGDCESMPATLVVTINAQPDAPVTTDINVCEGEPVILSAVSSNAVSWSENADGTSPIANPDLGTSLPAGSYVYYASASNGTCTSEASALIVTVGGGSFGTPTVTDIVVCEGEPVILAATGSGIGSISFYDATGALVSPNLGTSLSAGTYTYTATEGDGNCESLVPASIAVTVNANPSIGTITNNSPLCEGETIEIDAPTIPNVDYAWTGPNGANLGTDEDLTITNAIKGNHQGLYTLVVTDQTTGCESAAMSTYVEVNTTPDGLVVSNSGVTCVGGTVSLTATGIFGATYEWSDPSGTVIATTQNHVLDNVLLSDGGTYSLTVNLGDCASSTLETVVSVNEGANVSAGLDVEVFQGESIQLLGTGGLSYSWSPGDYLSNPSAADPIFSGAPIGVYNYTLTGYGANSCSGSDDVRVTVVPNTELEIVDLFTPNGDGVNDTWTITYLENLKDGYTLKIYARGGIQILETTNYNNDWDGTLDGKELPDGTYWYVISAGDGTDYKGAVTMKR